MTIFSQSLGSYWFATKDGDPRVSAIYRRHYSCYQYADNRRDNINNRNRHLVMGPGEKLVLLSADCKAIFGWRYFQDDYEIQPGVKIHGVNCAFFRNENAFNGMVKASDMLEEAERIAWAKWPGLMLYTYVEPKAVKGNVPGYSFRYRRWKRIGVTKKKKLLVLGKTPK